ncbi:MAG TPA: hypothetical protein VN278_00585 [Methanosarcina sp.]|nr:hypothetical protein [Methanosarcina sp.]
MSKQSTKSKAKKEPPKRIELTEKSSITGLEAPEKKVIIKEKTPEEKEKAHKEGIIKTIVASILGIAAGVLVFSFYGAGEDRVWYAVLTIVIGLTYFIQKLIYPQFKIDVKEFKLKDWLYVEFIIIDFFLVTWTLLLN